MTYFGSMVRYILLVQDDISNGLEINVEVKGSEASHNIGETVGIDIKSEDLHIF